MTPLNPVADQPTVSILIPSYNQGQFIRECIDSILQQDYRPIRIHVVDGASTDETVDVLKSYGDRPELDWVSEPDNGVVDAVNKGFRRVDGDIIGIQSSDDMYLSGTIAAVVDAFRSSPSVGLVYGDTLKVDGDGNELLRQKTSGFSLKNLFTFRTWIPQPSAFFRRELLAQCGGWDESIPYAPDTDLWIRMAYRCEVQKLDAFLSRRRMHANQRDTQGAKIIRDFSKMVDQSEEIATSDPEIRKAAQAGKHLIRIRYNTCGSDWLNAWNLYRAGRLCPEIADHKQVLQHLCLPTRRFLSRVKQTLLKRGD
ncbi:glycosyltransferase [Stieleria sp. ICT_E10.1]|uniref:glycosyltransferase family 2 protein n=1 Tax=Stieleria sedimenti TaxID=2976331 RepID=UPI00217FFF02|nr:glycosyltransferase family 2 protein [Stieleria sedimenti]MCS7469431.1 glycosyltransferase [Stieleria sedimenti]